MRRYLLGTCMIVVTAMAAGACSSDRVTSPTPPPQSPPATPPAPAPPPAPPPSVGITTDEALFRLITESQPFSGYTPFPRLADTVLPAAGAHVPFVRVSLNATAAGALENGRLASGTTFPDGSVIFKEVLTSGRSVTVYAVMYKDRTNASAGNGWLWAEYRPDGRVDYSIRDRGGACTGCHSLSDGPRNDSVRMFERQR